VVICSGILSGNMQEEEEETIVKPMKIPKNLAFGIKSSILEPSEFLETIEVAFLVYQALFV
jgi:hypothetical protein